MKFETITTERLLLRKLTPEDYRVIFSNYKNAEIKKLLGANSDEDLAFEYEKYKKGYTSYRTTILSFQLVDKASNVIIGKCGYHNWYSEHMRAEIGYHLSEESFKRKGLMTEALTPIIDYGFNQMNLNRIEALIGPNNAASLQLIGKFGFKQEGLLKQHYLRDNVFEDSIVFALLKDEYKLN